MEIYKLFLSCMVKTIHRYIYINIYIHNIYKYFIMFIYKYICIYIHMYICGIGYNTNIFCLRVIKEALQNIREALIE